MSADQQDLEQHAAESGWQPQPQPPAQPKKRHRVRNTLLAVLAGFVALVTVLVVVSSGSGKDSTSTGSGSSSGALSNSTNTEHPPAKDLKVSAAWGLNDLLGNVEA